MPKQNEKKKNKPTYQISDSLNCEEPVEYFLLKCLKQDEQQIKQLSRRLQCKTAYIPSLNLQMTAKLLYTALAVESF